MSGERQEQVPHDWESQVRRAEEAFAQFRESRLFMQIVLSVGLVAFAFAASVLPAARVREALTWTVTHDYDFAGRWDQARRWADDEGGWRPALAGVWAEQTARVKALLPATPGTKQAPAPSAPAPAISTPVEPEPEPSAENPADPATETLMPVKGKVLYGYGWLPKGQEPHGGLDLAAAVGEAVVAIHDGTVLRVAADSALGGLVEVDHGFAVALYGQVGGSKVKAGEKVKKGQALATVAKPTGKEGGREPHLHFEIRVTREGKPVDPAQFLPLGAGAQGGDGN